MRSRRWSSIPFPRRIPNERTRERSNISRGGRKKKGRELPSAKALVQRYRSRLEENGLAPSSINVQLAALRKLAMEAADNGLLDPAVASAIGRVKGAVQKGKRIGRWRTREEASALLRDSGEDGLKAKRDCALLCLLLGAGL
jgi:site-specific recombinase XerC